eukprot:6183633-Pleurochrysis_carterae.AAC.3
MPVSSAASVARPSWLTRRTRLTAPRAPGRPPFSHRWNRARNQARPNGVYACFNDHSFAQAASDGSLLPKTIGTYEAEHYTPGCPQNSAGPRISLKLARFTHMQSWLCSTALDFGHLTLSSDTCFD